MLVDPPTQTAGALPLEQLFRLTVAQYHGMSHAGIFTDDERVELLEGLLIRKNSPSVPVATGMIDFSEIYQLSVEQYGDLVRLGILAEDDPVELIEGVLFKKMTRNPPHATSVRRARRAIEPLLQAGQYYDSEQPIRLDTTEPEPDGAIIRGSIDDYADHHPTANDVLLVIEVAESSLLVDRTVKLRSYARAGIPVYWIINLIDRQIEVHTDPDPTAAQGSIYRRRDVYTGAAAVPVADTTVSAATLLPPA